MYMAQAKILHLQSSAGGEATECYFHFDEALDETKRSKWTEFIKHNPDTFLGIEPGWHHDMKWAYDNGWYRISRNDKGYAFTIGKKK